jgi:hypothetical protein
MMLRGGKVMARSILEPGYMDANRPRDMANGIEISATIPANLNVFISLGTIITEISVPTVPIPEPALDIPRSPDIRLPSHLQLYGSILV